MSAIASNPGVIDESKENLSLTQIAFLRFRRDKAAMFALGFVGVFVFLAITANVFGWITHQDPYLFNEDVINLDNGGTPIGKFGGISSMHWFGVEPGTGRDLFMRFVHGARTSLIIAFASTIGTILLGTFIGLIAGYFGGLIEKVVGRVIDFILTFPFLLFVIAATPVLENSLERFGIEQSPTFRIITIISIFVFFGWTGTARLVRGQVLSLKEREFIDAARVAGASKWHIIFKEILPNLSGPILVISTLALPSYVTAEAVLSYLNVGVIAPTPSWGATVLRSTPYFEANPTYMLIPAVSLTLLVLSFNLFGDGIRDAFDPKGQK
jgi:peptide/nickel transport system permease protein